MVDRLLSRWTGIALSLVGATAILALAATNQLSLYIHPRYHLFTVVMAVLGGGAALAAVAWPARADVGHAGHDHGPTGRGRRWSVAVRSLIVGLAAICLLVLPPASLTGTTLQKREVASTARISSGTDLKKLVGSDPLTFSVKDWAGLLAQGGPKSVLDRPVKASAYVLDRDDEQVFFAVRMLVTCCAVDAQPVGIPVLVPNWRETYREGEWVELSGTFVENPDARSRYPVAVDVDRIEKIAEPEQPYVF